MRWVPLNLAGGSSADRSMKVGLSLDAFMIRSLMDIGNESSRLSDACGNVSPENDFVHCSPTSFCLQSLQLRDQQSSTDARRKDIRNIMIQVQVVHESSTSTSQHHAKCASLKADDSSGLHPIVLHRLKRTLPVNAGEIINNHLALKQWEKKLRENNYKATNWTR